MSLKWIATVLADALAYCPDFVSVEEELDSEFEELMDTFCFSRKAFDKTEDMFWKLRVQNSELKEQVRVLKDEVDRLRDHHD